MPDLTGRACLTGQACAPRTFQSETGEKLEKRSPALLTHRGRMNYYLQLYGPHAARASPSPPRVPARRLALADDGADAHNAGAGTARGCTEGRLAERGAAAAARAAFAARRAAPSAESARAAQERARASTRRQSSHQPPHGARDLGRAVPSRPPRCRATRSTPRVAARVRGRGGRGTLLQERASRTWTQLSHAWRAGQRLSGSGRWGAGFEAAAARRTVRQRRPTRPCSHAGPQASKLEGSRLVHDGDIIVGCAAVAVPGQSRCPPPDEREFAWVTRKRFPSPRRTKCGRARDVGGHMRPRATRVATSAATPSLCSLDTQYITTPCSATKGCERAWRRSREWHGSLGESWL